MPKHFIGFYNQREKNQLSVKAIADSSIKTRSLSTEKPFKN
ncbi:MAG: hypothetical protein VKL41_01635 [Snowella sp.]|nr:hypothetical protein [Snowella sp.]